MPLADMILRLRSQANMSQGDLADQLGVSRQSVSKWETGGAIPDLDKLVKLSELFGVSLDTLVKGETPVQEEGALKNAEPQVVYIREERSSVPQRKIVGYALYGFALLVVILSGFVGGIFAGLLLSVPFWVCGSICFLFKQRIGLWCAWSMLFCGDVFLRFFTGATWGSIFAVMRGILRMDAANVAACVILLLVAVLIWRTVRSYKIKILEPTKNVRVCFIIKIIGLILCCIPWPISIIGQKIAADGQMMYRFARTAQVLSLGLEWGKWVFLTLLLIEVFAIQRWKVQNKSKPRVKRVV